MRGNGEGSIRKRKDGRWEARYYTGRDSKTGKHIRRSVIGKTRKEVAEKLREKLSQLDIGTYVNTGKVTLNDWLNTWLWEVKQPQIKPSTFGSYVDTYNREIKETQLANMKLKDIRRYHIQAFVDDKVKEGLSAYRVNYAYGIIRNAFNTALQRGLIPISYADKVSLPKKKPKKTTIFTPEQQSTFLQAIKGHRLEAVFVVALTTGLREGELAALTWADYDQDKEILTVDKNVIRVFKYDPITKEKTGSELIIQDSPKSSASERIIPLLPITIKALNTHRIKQKEERLKNGKLYVDNNLIFCNEIGGLYDPKNFYSRMRDICEKTEGLEQIKFHALRHTFATRGLEADISGKAMQGLLGHETEAMTLQYQHMLEEQTKKEMNKLESVFR